MELVLDCLPCLLKQALHAARKATPDVQVQTGVIRDAAQLLACSEAYSSAPALCEEIHRLVRRQCGTEDPYREDKRREITLAREMLPELLERVEAAPDPLELALHIAAAGNVIDAAVGGCLTPKSFMQEIQQPFALCHMDQFRRDLSNAHTVLYIGDNAGEAVFDTVLLRRLAPRNTTYAVRSAPVLNDVTLEDARAAGVCEYAAVVSSGCAAPGCLLDACTEDFKRLFNTADLVIAKGQGNYEALSDVQRPVYFLLKAKCLVLAQHLNVPQHSYVLATSC